jgi:Carboxypeptidase regulatory-like domain/TonB-dependent Receptor Plug Domain
MGTRRLIARCRVSAWLSAFFLMLSVLSGAADAQVAQAPLRVQVVDAANRRPVALARVELRGPETLSAYTGPDGIATFEHVLPGDYKGSIFRPGFTSAAVENATVRAGQSVEIVVSLAPHESPKVIGTVRVRSASSPAFDALNQNSAQQRLFGSAEDALRTLPDVTVGAYGDVSIDGRDPTQTGFALDGVPLSGLGGLRGIDADLFGGVNVVAEPSAGRLGGSLGFTTLEPTIAFEGASTAGADSFNQSLTASARGTSGLVGYVVGHVVRGRTGPLDGLRFPDASGFAYDHRNGIVTQTDLAKVRVPLSESQSFTLTAIHGNESRDDVCNRWSALVPCGFGPGNGQSARTDVLVGSYLAQSGSTTIRASAATTQSRIAVDDSRTLIDLVPSPFTARAATSGTTVDVSASGRAGRNHVLRGEFLAMTQSLSLDTTGAPASQHLVSDDRFSRFLIGDEIRLTRTLTADVSAYGDRNRGRLAPFGSAAVTVTPDDRTLGTVRFSTSGGGGGTSFGVFRDPKSLTYDCRDRAVIGSMPGTQDDSAPSATTLTAMLRRRTASGATINASFTSQTLRDTTFGSFVSAARLPAQALPPGYLDAITATFASAVPGCGTTAFDPSRVFLERPVSVPAIHSAIARVAVARAIGTAGIVAAGVSYNRSVPTTGPTTPYETVFNGHQLPHVPEWRGTLVADIRPPRSRFEGLLLLDYTGSNNPANLPAHTIVNAGLSMQLARGSLTVSALNVFGTDAGVYATPQAALPLQGSGGTEVPALAQPLRGRTVHVQYAVRFGAQTAPRMLSAADLEAADAEELGRYALVPHELTRRPQSEHFAPTIGAVTCTPELLAPAHAELDALKTITGRLEDQHRATGAYPKTADVPAATVAGLSVAYVQLRNSYALRIYASRRAVKPLAQCGYFSGIDQREAERLGLYAPVAAPGEEPSAVFAYAPDVGLYYVGESQTINLRDRGHLDALPNTPPQDPYALKSSCPAEGRPAAVQLVSDVHQAVGLWRDRKPIGKGSFLTTITAHGSIADGFLQITLTDPTTIDGILGCLNVAGATSSALAEHHAEGVALPQLTYSPRFGFYVRIDSASPAR